MPDKILIAYASRTGSTADAAHVIGAALAESGAQVDVRPVQDVTDLAPYRAVVVGSAIRGSKWLPEAVRFVQAHRADLARKPVAMFTVCITLAMSSGDKYRQAVMGWTEPVRAQVNPVSEGLFAGMLDFGKLPLSLDVLLLRLAVAVGVFPRGDRRDPNAVRAWAESLRPLLL